jgi:F0F1-type ATP synthase membrane subunit a
VIAAAEESGGATGYILHHQANLSNKAAHGIVDFSVINYDTVFFSVLLAVVFFGAFWMVASRCATLSTARVAWWRRWRSRSSAGSSSSTSWI